jgi:hypothetical protein
MRVDEFLESIARLMPPREDLRYSSYEELVLDYGTRYTEVRLDVSGPIKECFTNAYLAAEGNGWTYVEGYADSIIPVQHAWCLDGDGIVVETTWETPGTEYFGVPLSTEWVGRVVAENGYWGVLGNDWLRDAVLLREGFPTEALAYLDAV